MARPLRNFTGFFVSPSSPTSSRSCRAAALSSRAVPDRNDPTEAKTGPERSTISSKGARFGRLGSTLATRLTLISNAATEAQRRAAFPSDEALSEQEMARVTALGWRAPVAQRIMSGPERRVRQTAKALGLTPEVDPDLRDCDYGEWRGFDLTRIQSREPEGIARMVSGSVRRSPWWRVHLAIDRTSRPLAGAAPGCEAYTRDNSSGSYP